MGDLGASGTSIDFEPPASGTLSVSAINSCGSSTPRTLAIYVLGIPEAPDTIVGEVSPCNGSAGTYTVEPAPGDTSYTWTFNGDTLAQTIEPSITFPVSSDGVLALSVSNECGTSPPAFLDLDPIPLPDAPGPITGDTAVCQNSVNTFSIVDVPGASGYVWSLPPTWSGSSSTNSVEASVDTMGGTISVAAENQCGTGPAIELQVFMATSPLQAGPIMGPSEMCQGAIDATYSVEPVAGAVEYDWSIPAGWSGTSNSESISVTTDGSAGIVSVRVFDGCGYSLPQELSISPSIVPPSVPSVVSGTNPVCSGASATYSVVNDPMADAYVWTLPGPTWSGASTTSTIDVIAGTTGGQLSVTATNMCGNSPVRLVTLFMLSPPTLTGITGDEVACTNIGTPYTTSSQPDATYVWEMTGASQTGQTTSTNALLVTWVTPGAGSISVSASNNCGPGPSVQLAVEIEDCTSVEEHAGTQEWAVYPNPANDVLFVDNSGNFGTPPTLTVYNAHGQSVMAPRILRDRQLTQLHVAEFEPGVYFVELLEGTRRSMFRFIKL